MSEKEMNERIGQIAQQMMDRFNLAAGMALEENGDFAKAEGIFSENIKALELYGCMDVIAAQKLNFAQIAFYKRYYQKAVSYSEEALVVCMTEAQKEKAACQLHDMCYQLLELGVRGEKELLELAASGLTAQDYITALETARSNQTDSPEVRRFVSALALELLRQGIRRQKEGREEEALALLKCSVDSLNPKRAAVVRQEIRNMEERKGHE